MAGESQIRDVIDAVTGVAKAVPIYQDIVQPAAQEIGKGLQTVAKTVHVLLAPVSAFVWGYDQIKEFISTKVSERLKNVPPENLVSPKPNVAGPVLEALRYTGHESSLSDLYANLLAAAMDSSTAEGAHPAFVEIIKQLTSDEAKIVSLFVREIPFPLLNLRWAFKPNQEGNIGGKAVLVYYSHLGYIAGCEFPKMAPTYIDNLCRLGLTYIPELGEYTAKGVYDDLENDSLIKERIEFIEKSPDIEPILERKALIVTELGKQFVRMCVRPQNN